MSEDPRDYGLDPADLRAAADLLYPPGDDRMTQVNWSSYGENVRFGRIRSRLRSLADGIEKPE